MPMLHSKIATYNLNTFYLSSNSAQSFAKVKRVGRGEQQVIIIIIIAILRVDLRLYLTKEGDDDKISLAENTKR
jgi:hypothetical protein